MVVSDVLWRNAQLLEVFEEKGFVQLGAIIR